MHFKVFISLVLFSLVLNVATSIVCTPEICAATQCKAVEGCRGPNQVIQPGGLCNCCNVCYTILRENEECSSITTLLQGAPPPTSGCGQGLICRHGKCRSFKALSQTYA